jgi:hypothetical protein
LIAPSTEDHDKDENLVSDLLTHCLDGEGMTVKDAVKLVAQQTGEPRSRVYQESMNLRK